MDFLNFIKRNSIHFFAIFLAFALLSFATPPMQSPDEGAHFKRAYLLSDGIIIMGNEEGKKSGGTIDSGLDRFVSAATVSDRDDAKDHIKELKSIEWAGSGVYSVAYNTAYNFPMVYLPQAISLAVGKLLGARVYDSYTLARILTFLTTLLILSYSAMINKIPTSVIAILLMPMTIFQLSSPVLDSITISLTVLIMSIYSASKKSSLSPVSFTVILLACFLVATSKANMLPICAVPFLTSVKIKNSIKNLLSFLPVIMAFAWIALALSSTNDGGVHHVGYSQGDVMKHYILHPLETITIIFNTVTDHDLVKFYYRSFLGILGPLTVTLSKNDYPIIAILLIMAVIFTHFTTKRVKVNAPIVIIAIACTGLIFCALLVQWSEFPTTKIDGIQGRYFIPPIIVLLFGISDSNNFSTVKDIVLVPAIFCISLYVTVTSLISFYH